MECGARGGINPFYQGRHGWQGTRVNSFLLGLFTTAIPQRTITRTAKTSSIQKMFQSLYAAIILRIAMQKCSDLSLRKKSSAKPA